MQRPLPLYSLYHLAPATRRTSISALSRAHMPTNVYLKRNVALSTPLNSPSRHPATLTYT